MGLLDNLLGGLGGGGRAAPKPVQQGYRLNLNVTDGDAAYNTSAELFALVAAATVGVWSKIWEKTVPAQMGYRWGYGSPAFPDNQGYMWFASLDSGTDFTTGVLRLVQANGRETRKIVVAEIPDSQLHSVTATTILTAALINKNEMIALPEQLQYPIVGEDSLLILEYNLIVGATTEDAADFRIPVTVYQ